MTVLLEAPGTHPTLSLGCGTFCTFNADGLISTGIAIVLTLAMGFYVRSRLESGVPNRFQAVFELFYDFVRGLVRENVHESATFVVPLAMTIGFYILVANWAGIVPLDLIPNVHPANEDLNQTAAMALVVIVVVQWYSLRVQGLRGYLRRFTKPFELPLPVRIFPYIPLNILEEVVKPVTLSLRLFGNLFAGGVMIFLILLLLPWPAAIPTLVVWKLFDVLFIGAIQALIFTLLTVVYFGQAREGLAEHH
ncbi:MAG TPA: F0F1 ATP synthase subunit A [Candidatus Acidoferrales bacterium]|nr:F0F1 ATP synthase subunit A [Candidatus Acidoferrales bacterium]